MHRSSPSFVPFVSFVFLVSAPARSHAQTTEAIGIRAQGMAGAFTAVANDATAAWWNPAGLASGPYFNAILEITRDRPATDGVSGADASVWQTGGAGFSVAYPGLGLSYYRLRLNQIRSASSTGAADAGRQDQGAGGVPPRPLVLNQFGATVGQSIGEHLVIGSTLKLLHAISETRGGIDVGALAKFGSAQFGLVVRNAREPTFGDGEAAVTLPRQLRAGVSLGAASGRALRGSVIAADFDLRRITTASGEERRFAIGAEAWAGSRIGLRGGFDRNTVGDTRSSVSGGVSAAVQSGTYIDVFATGGSDRSRRGWGAAFRLTF
jgi:hypothetical protein